MSVTGQIFIVYISFVIIALLAFGVRGFKRNHVLEEFFYAPIFGVLFVTFFGYFSIPDAFYGVSSPFVEHMLVCSSYLCVVVHGTLTILRF